MAPSGLYARFCHAFSSFSLFSPLGKLAGGISILPMFFLYFFLMVDFLAPVAQTLMEQSSPKF